jgi:curved DNA-binding protein
VEVTIPRGISDGTKMRVGDVVLRVRVGHHPLFRRSEVRDGPEQGPDLYLDLPLTIAEATLGATVSVPTLESAVELSIPPGTSSGRKLRVRSQGVQDVKGAKGDLYVITRIVVPDGAGLPAPDAEALRRIAARTPDVRSSPEWVR